MDEKKYFEDDEKSGEKTKAIVSFALCGFANLSSIAILLGGLGSLAPSRRQDIARFGLKAVLAATLSKVRKFLKLRFTRFVTFGGRS